MCFFFLEIPQAYMTRLVEPFEELTMCVLLAVQGSPTATQHVVYGKSA